MSLRILIVEDEMPARAALKETLRECAVPHVLVGEAKDADEGVALMDTFRPDAVLLDIRLGMHTGFDVLERTMWKSARVIFTTAYDQYAIRAFRCAAVDYLLKPVRVELLSEALQRVAHGTVPGTLETLVRNWARPKEERIVVPVGEGMHIIAPRDIVRCEADGNYTRLFLLNGDRVVTARTLKDFEELLAVHGFERPHLSHVVNLGHVRKYVNRDGGYLVMSDGSSVPVSQRRRQEVLDALGKR